MRFVLFVWLILLAPYHSWANQEDDYLWMAKTAGSWSDGNKVGFYRVKVYRVPGEAHSGDDVVVDILERDGSGKQFIKKIVPLDVPGYRGYIRDISFKKIDGERMAIIFGIEMKAMEGLVLREILLISPNGEVKTLVEAKYRDIYDLLSD